MQRIIRNYIDALRTMPPDMKSEYFGMIALQFVPLMRLLLPTLVKRCEDEIGEYEALAQKVHQEGIDALAALKMRLHEAKLFNNQSIQQCFHYCDPYSCINHLLNELLTLGRLDIVQDYAEIEYYKEFTQICSCFRCGYGYKNESISRKIQEQSQNWVCPKCQSDIFQVHQYSTIQKRLKCLSCIALPIYLISSYIILPAYTFSSSTVELMERYRDYDPNNIKKIYAAWDYLLQPEFDILKI